MPNRGSRPPSPVRSPLTREFLGIVAIVVALVVGVHLAIVSSDRNLLRHKLEDCRRVGAVLSAIITKEMREGASHRVQRHLEEIPLGDDLVSIRVFDDAGRMVYAVGDAQPLRVVDRARDALCRECHAPGATPDRAGRTTTDRGRRLFRVDIPIANAAECAACHSAAGAHVGNLLIETTFTPAELASMRQRRTLALAGGVTMVLAVAFLGLLLDARILRPLRELCAGVQAARDADAAPVVRVRRPDEIGYLATTFNETVAVMREHRDHLESLVARRTAQLEESRAEMIHRESLSAAGRLAAGMAHEIGNPLSAISTLCQYVLRKRRDDELVTEQLTLVENQVRRLADLTGRMMDLSRPAPPDVGAVDVNELVTTACDLARMDKRLGGQQLALRLEPGLPLARAHADIVVPAVLNLVLNAADAGAGAGPVPITAETGLEGGRIVVRIIDHCGGGPPGLERRIFEPFFTTRTDRGGCGLGLSVTTSLLRSIGGDLALRNRPGVGATFVIFLEPGRGERT